MSGQGITNWRYQPNETEIGTGLAGTLRPAWVDSLAGDISATPAVVDGAVYVPDWGGNISKLDADTGAVIWSKSVATLTGVAGAISRTSPAVSGNSVVFGTQRGGRLVSVDKNTGTSSGVTQLDCAPAGDRHPVSDDLQRRGLRWRRFDRRERRRLRSVSERLLLPWKRKRGRPRHRRGHLEDLHDQQCTAGGRILRGSRLGLLASHRREAELGLHHHGQQLRHAPERAGLRGGGRYRPRGAGGVRATGQRELRRRDPLARHDYRRHQVGEQDAGVRRMDDRLHRVPDRMPHPCRS